MSQSKFWLMLSLAGCLCAPFAYADDATMEDDTVTVVDDGETPEDVTNQITLPDSASETAQEHSAFGQGVSALARDKGELTGHDFGQQVSEQARARELGNEVREDLQSNQRSDARGDNAGDHGRP